MNRVDEIAKVMMWQHYHPGVEPSMREDPADRRELDAMFQKAEPWLRKMSRRQARQMIDILDARGVLLVDERALPPAKVEDLR